VARNPMILKHTGDTVEDRELAWLEGAPLADGERRSGLMVPRCRSLHSWHLRNSAQLPHLRLPHLCWYSVPPIAQQRNQLAGGCYSPTQQWVFFLLRIPPFSHPYARSYEHGEE